MIIKQEKTDKELEEYSNKIIDMLTNLNLVDKYKVINALHIQAHRKREDKK